MEFPRILKNSWLRRLLWAAGLLLALGTVAVLALPGLLKSQIESRGSQELGRKLTLGALAFKPWTLELTLTDLKMASADGQSTQFSVARVYADASIQSLWRLAPVLDALTIDQPQVRLTHLGDGHYDIDDLLQRLAPAPDAKPSEPARFALHQLLLSEGSVDFVDQVDGQVRQHNLRKLKLALPFVSNLEAEREQAVQPQLAFELNGSTFDSSAQATPFATVRKGELALTIQHLDVAPYLPYLPASLPVRLKAGVLDSALTLSFAQGTTNQLLVSGTVKLSNLRMQGPSGAELLSVGAVQAEIKELRPLEHSLTLASLTVDAPSLRLTRNRAGALNLPGTAAADVDAKPAPVEWKVALERLALQGGQVRLTDDSVSPSAQFALSDTRLTLRDMHWPMDRPAQFEAATRLSARDTKGIKPVTLQLQGAGTDQAGSLTAQVSDLGLALAAPYLRTVLLPQAKGMLEGELAVRWKEGAVQLQAKRLALHDFALTQPAGKTDIPVKELPSFKLLEASEVAVDLQQHAVTVGKLALRGPALRLARGEDGQWMFARWLPAAAPAVAPPAVPETKASPRAKTAPWRVALADILLDEGTLTFVDRVPSKPVFLELSALQTRLKNLTLDGKKPVPVSLSAKVRSVRTDPGTLRFDGTLMRDPLLAQGTLVAAQFPAQALAPYGMGKLRLELLRADTSFKGSVRYADLPAGAEVQVRGDAAVEELRLNSWNTGTAGAASLATGEPLAAGSASKPGPRASATEELLNWKALSAPGIEFSMAPGVPLHLKVRELSLADFFARLIVNPQGRLVLQDLVASDEPNPEAPVQGAAPQLASANDPVIDIGPIRLVNGRVAFSDRFIQPHYSADLTELSGGLSRFSSQQTPGIAQLADLELRGRAEGTASLEITGKLNPLAKPLELAITGKVRDLELSPLSSYAIKYAGYGIERGKLSVDVNYTVAPDGQLQASNKLVLNQLVFGDEVPGANHLPVKLAVALLADRNGVIDLDLPVSGSLNDPTFRVWPIVWKIVGNIVAKALLSPFALMSGLLSGDSAADELSNVAFEPGTARISAAALPGLNQVAQVLLDKPSLRLTVVGTASLERESEAIQRDRLQAQLLAEKRRAAASAAKDVTAVAAVSPEEAPALLKEVFRRSNIRKPRNAVGLVKDLGNAEMEVLLLQAIAVDEDTARALALNRSLAVREYLTAKQLPSDRLFMGVANTAPAQADWQPRAELSIEHH
jgi:uncharacterized protein involved in outer membrane biogenesis